METITVELFLGRITPGTVRYEARDDDAPVTQVYVRKKAFGDAEWPAKVRLIVEGQ